MNGELSVALRALKFFAYHGIFPEEQKTGNDFNVDLLVTFKPKAGTITDISDTISYVELYELVKEEMSQTTPLLETLAMRIAGRIHDKFPFVKRISISIYKMNPPIAKFPGNVGTRFEKEY